MQLVGKSVATANGPPPEMTITLASLVAPLLSRGTRISAEEPFAWESREFLRNLCVGSLLAVLNIYNVVIHNV